MNALDSATPARRDAAKRALENMQKLKPYSPETLLALGYYQYYVLRDYGAVKTTFERVTKMLPGSSDVPYALALVTRRGGHWDKGIAYFEQALALTHVKSSCSPMQRLPTPWFDGFQPR